MADPLLPTAPKEVVEYFDRRGTRTSWRWTDFAPHEHALGFTVARTAGFDVIEDLRAAVRKAAVERIPFEQFQNELTPILQQKGWWGKKVIKDPKGFKEEVQLGSLRRLKTIYWANIRSSHAAGEWVRTQATKEVLPYLRYKISLAAERRKEHMSWVGTTLPVDHPWWRTHYPPNGWHCQCRVEQIGEAAASKMPADKRKAPPLNVRMWQDTRSGKVWRVPDGIDPGWQGNPGLTRERTAAIRLADRLDLLSHLARSTAIADYRSLAAFRHVAGNAAGLPYPLPRVGRSDAVAAAARTFAPVASVERDRLALSGVVQLSGEDAAKMVVKHGLTTEAYESVQSIIDQPDAAFMDQGKRIFVALINGRAWRIVIKVTADGLNLLNSFHRISRQQYNGYLHKGGG